MGENCDAHKGQLISQNDLWMSSFEPKNERKYFSISALPGSNHKNNGSLSC